MSQLSLLRNAIAMTREAESKENKLDSLRADISEWNIATMVILTFRDDPDLSAEMGKRSIMSDDEDTLEIYTMLLEHRASILGKNT